MDWSSDTYRANFLFDLLTLYQVDPDAMMDMLYDTLVNDWETILDNGNSPEEIENALSQVIDWFAKNEKYEQCHELKQIKDKCLKLK